MTTSMSCSGTPYVSELSDLIGRSDIRTAYLGMSEASEHEYFGHLRHFGQRRTVLPFEHSKRVGVPDVMRRRAKKTGPKWPGFKHHRQNQLSPRSGAQFPIVTKSCTRFVWVLKLTAYLCITLESYPTDRCTP